MDQKDRMKMAWDAIKNAYGTEMGADSVTLFIQHHLAELSASYWQQHLSNDAPEPAAVINLLELTSTWSDGGIEHLDFTFPDDVTSYVISVSFDSSGRLDTITMES